MKLRTTNNSIRIRIRKSELALLKNDSKIEEVIYFPNDVQFAFALAVAKEVEEISVSLNQNTLTILIPHNIAIGWINTNQVGIEYNLPISIDKNLHVLIEKDFPCLDRSNEDKSDTFWELAPTETPEKCCWTTCPNRSQTVACFSP